MVQTFQTGFTTTLGAKLSPSDTSMVVAVAPTVTAGRLKIGDGENEEWVSYTGVSGTTLTGLTRNLSKTADPSTGGTGKTHIAGTPVKLVAMHDQLIDKQQPTYSNQVATTFATTAARDSALGGNGAATQAYVDIWVTAEGLYYNYNLTTGQWEAVDTGTVTPNATTSTAGIVEISTTGEFNAGTDTGGTGATLVTIPSQIQGIINNAAAKTTPANADKFLLSDSDDLDIYKSITYLNLYTAISTSLSSLFKYGGDSSDGAVDGTAGITVAGSNDTIIVKNYSSWAAGSAPRTLAITPTGCVLYIKIRGNADFSNWTFDVSGKGGAGGVAVTGNSAGGTGTASLVFFGANSNGAGVGGNGGGNGGGGGAGSGASGSNGGTGGTGGTRSTYPTLLQAIQGQKYVVATGGAGGGGGGATVGGTSGAGGAGGGVLIIEVGGNLTLNNSTTVMTANGAVGANASVAGAGAGGGGGGGGGIIYVMYGGTLTGTCTPTVAGGTGGTQLGGGSNGGAGGAGLQLIEKNVAFT